MKTLNDFVKKYPFAFSNLENNSPFKLFGFECGDGWYDLLEPVIAWINDFNEKNQNSRIHISQIKEKYGTLRFYTSTSFDELDKLIDEAENKSEVTCETCGQPGKMRGKGWYYVSCEKHTSEKDKITN